MRRIIQCMVIFGIVILMAGFPAGVLFAQDHNVTLTWEPQNPKMNESVKFTVSAPGAEKVRFYNNTAFRTFDGDSGTKSITFINSRTEYVTARALYDGVWTPLIPGQTINFSVTGTLAKVNAVVPSSIALSSSFSFSFTKISNAEKYSYCIYPSDDYCRKSYSISAADYSGQTISYTTDITKDLPAGEYVFEIAGKTPGYFETESHYLFEIGSSSQSLPSAPTVSITKNQFTLGDQEPLGLQITANGATKLRYCVSAPNFFSQSPAFDPAYFDNFSTYNFTQPGEYSMRFSALINGTWSAYSDPVRFTLVSNGVAPQVNFSIPETVESGGILSVSIEPVANVDFYDITVYKSNEGSSDYFKGSYAETTDQPVEISMDNAEIGEYAVGISFYLKGYETENSYRPFLVTGADFVLPANLTDINSYAFSKAGMKSVTIPTKVKTISAYAFEGCPNLTSVNISNGPTSIGEYAFANNSKLTKVTIPNSVQSIAENAFSNCSNLTTISVTAGSYADQWALSHGFSVNYN